MIFNKMFYIGLFIFVLLSFAFLYINNTDKTQFRTNEDTFFVYDNFYQNQDKVIQSNENILTNIQQNQNNHKNTTKSTTTKNNTISENNIQQKQQSGQQDMPFTIHKTNTTTNQNKVVENDNTPSNDTDGYDIQNIIANKDSWGRQVLGDRLYNLIYGEFKKSKESIFDKVPTTSVDTQTNKEFVLYANSLTEAFKNKPGIQKSYGKIIGEAFSEKNKNIQFKIKMQSIKKDLETASNQYFQFAEYIEKLIPPDEIKDLHLSLVNNLKNYALSIKKIANSQTEQEFVSNIVFKNTFSKKIIKDIVDISSTYKAYNIQFNPSDPGAVIMWSPKK